MKLKKNINGQLQEKKHELVEDIKAKYNKANITKHLMSWKNMPQT